MPLSLRREGSELPSARVRQALGNSYAGKSIEFKTALSVLICCICILAALASACFGCRKKGRSLRREDPELPSARVPGALGDSYPGSQREFWTALSARSMTR
jgi:hypothetical protein